MSTREEWVRVESESELRPGMPVEVRTCIICGKRDRMILSGVRVATTNAVSRRRVYGWPVIGGCDAENYAHLTETISEGRLYRLSDLTDDSDTTVATKELVMT